MDIGYLWIIVVLGVIQQKAESTPPEYSLRNFNDLSGVFFQDMGTTHIYQTKCRIITYIDLRQLLIFHPYFRIGCSSYFAECFYVKNLFNETLAQEQAKLLDMLQMSEEGSPLPTSVTPLFGSFDTNDVNFYNRNIVPTPLQSIGNKTIFKLLDTRTLFLQSVFGTSLPQRLLQMSFKLMSNDFGNSVSLLNHVHLLQLFDQWKLDLRTLTTAILFAKEGKIHPEILSREDLLNASITLKQYFKENIVLQSLDNEDIINISEVRVAVVNEKLIYELSIPIVEPDSYQLYRLIPMPMKLSSVDTYFFVDPAEEYVIVKAHHLHYVPLFERELRNCKSTKGIRFCSVSRTSTHYDFADTCENSLITNNYRKNLFSTCTVKLIKSSKTMWYQVENTNAWIFSTSQDSLNVTCQGKPTVTLALENSGYLKLNSTCAAATKEVLLKPLHSFNEISNIDMPVPFLRLDLRKDVEGFVKNLSIALDDIVANDLGYSPYLDVASLKLKGTPLEQIRTQAKSAKIQETNAKQMEELRNWILKNKEETKTLQNWLFFSAAMCSLLFLCAWFKPQLWNFFLKKCKCCSKCSGAGKRNVRIPRESGCGTISLSLSE